MDTSDLTDSRYIWQRLAITLMIGRAVDGIGVHIAISMAANGCAIGHGFSALTPSIFIVSLLQFVIGFEAKRVGRTAYWLHSAVHCTVSLSAI